MSIAALDQKLLSGDEKLSLNSRTSSTDIQQMLISPELGPDATLDFFTTLKRTTYIGFQVGLPKDCPKLPSRDLEEMSGSAIPGYTQRLVCCGQGTSHSPTLLPHTDYKQYKDLVVDKGGQPNHGRTTRNGLGERQIVDIILENVSPLTRQQFVFTSKPCTVQELFYMASTIENTMLSEKEYLVARAPADTIRSRVGLTPESINMALSLAAVPSNVHDANVSGNSSGTRDRAPRDLSRVRRFPCQSKVVFLIKIDKFSWKHPFFVVPDLPFDIILGNDFMFDTRVKLDLGRLGISFSFEPSVFIPFCIGDNPRDLFSIVEECEAMDRLVGRFPDVITDRRGKCDILPYDIVAQDHIPVRSAKPTRNSKIGFHSADVTRRPWKRVFVDFIDLLTRSSQGNTSILDIDILSVAFNAAFHESVILLLANWDIDPLLDDAGDCSDEEKCELTFKNLQNSVADRSSAKLAYKWSGLSSIDRFLTPVSVVLKEMPPASFWFFPLPLRSSVCCPTGEDRRAKRSGILPNNEDGPPCVPMLSPTHLEMTECGCGHVGRESPPESGRWVLPSTRDRPPTKALGGARAIAYFLINYEFRGRLHATTTSWHDSFQTDLRDHSSLLTSNCASPKKIIDSQYAEVGSALTSVVGR
uniref:Uncharacterized protein n=1 Tax=Timema poppense TaxID=170557 RepID=A0A7R9CUZ7_TIMPO|nr:unnamed protein product [Timema poppensis]